MQVILIKNVNNLGKEGDAVKVKDGYARNYLFPKKLAMPYNAGAIKFVEAKKKKALLEAQKQKAKAEELAGTISALSLNIPMEAGQNDALFGSVTSDTIFHALQQENIQVDKKDIIIEEPIKKLGVYNVVVNLHPEVKQNLRIWVVKK